MATDVARLSFDPGRQYTGVVPQQGRVSLEAEQNEQRVIDAEERRKELLDIIGPAGTPDDGYAVSFVGDVLTVGVGTMYVGGLRVEFDTPVRYTHQSDWLDGPSVMREGLWHVLLHLREADVTAVEDPMLYEPALGGPDGATRTRLLQHVELLKTSQRTCAKALEQDEKTWSDAGATFDPGTMRLESNGRLLVAWEGVPDSADPCEPSSTGGYLGAENQLIRVQIVGNDQDGTFSILWGYDDASMLYRVTPDSSTNPVFTLQRSPVDDFHRPRAGQAVQVLRSTAALSSTDGVVEGYAAALNGEVGVLAAPYDPDTKTVQFPAALPAPYTDIARTPQLYLRVWEELITGNSLDSPITLGGTGIQVTISIDGGGPPRPGDFWCIGVRPSTPTTVYPDRLLREAQPPDGPREWVCPLAVVNAFRRENSTVIEDCRIGFPPLTAIENEGCCTVEVHPRDIAEGKLQAIVDRATAGRDPRDRTGRVTICFAPGRYELPEPLVLRRHNSNIWLQACTQGAIISAEAGKEDGFRQGLFVLADVDEVTITGFEFELPQVSAQEARVGGVSGSMFNREAVRAVNDVRANGYVSIAIRTVDCAVLEVTDCTFRFSVGEHQPRATDQMPRNVFGVAIFASGRAWGVQLRNNVFSHHPEQLVEERGEEKQDVHLLIGYLLVPTAAPRKDDLRAVKSLGAAHVSAVLDAAQIADNRFYGITAAVAVVATIGTVRIWDNVVDQCYGGFWLLDADTTASTDLTGRYQAPVESRGVLTAARSAITGLLFDPYFAYAVIVGETYPLPLFEDFVPGSLAQHEKDAISKLRGRARTVQTDFMNDMTRAFSTGHEVVAVPASGDAAAAQGPAGQAVSKKKATTVEFNPAEDEGTEFVLRPLSPNYAAAWSAINELQRISPAPERLDTRIRIESNGLDLRVGQGDLSGPALFVYSVRDDDTTATVMIAINRIVTPLARISTALIGPRFATVTGNVIVSTTERTATLAVALVPEVAITGNVVRGPVLLPTRPFPAPLDTWQPLNTING
jgi:hypothetical protein